MDKARKELFYRSIERPPEELCSEAEVKAFGSRTEKIEFMGHSGVVRFPVWLQLAALGLDKSYGELKGKRVLDIGCGEHSDLVYSLRGYGVDIEGIDPRARDELYFMRQAIYAGEKGIPRPDESYDMVVMNSVPAFNGPSIDEKDLGAALRVNTVVSEALRVLKPGCEFRSFPAIPSDIYALKQTLSQCGGKIREENAMGELDFLPVMSEMGFSRMFRRTIVTKDL